MTRLNVFPLQGPVIISNECELHCLRVYSIYLPYRPNTISPVIKAIVKSDSVGVDRDLEVLDLEIKIYPCMLTLLNEVMSVKSCWQNTWKNATLSMNPSKLQNSDCFIQSSMVIRIGYLNVSLLQDESSSAEIHLDFRLKEACIHYIQKSLTNQRFWFSRAFNTESDSKLLVSIDSGSVLISGKVIEFCWSMD